MQPCLGAIAQGGLAGGLTLLLFSGAVLLLPELYGEAASSADRLHVLLVLAGAFIAIFSLLWLWQADRASLSNALGPAGKTLYLRLAEDGMTIQSIPAPRTLSWAQLKTIEEDDSYVIFCSRNGDSLILPKQVWGSAEACREFVDKAEACRERSKALGAA